MSTVKEIQAAIPKLSREEIEQIRTWINDYLEDQFELTDDVKAKLDQSRPRDRSRTIYHPPAKIDCGCRAADLVADVLEGI